MSSSVDNSIGASDCPAGPRSKSAPKIVAFGGGTGMAALLLGLKAYTDQITAVVTVTDNGGSSGLLRNEFDMVAPGDIRNCLLALAEVDPLITRALQYRFDESEFKGHCFGNLFITVLTRLVGDFGVSIRELNRILNVRGRVVPASSAKVSLVAQHPDGSKSTGEVQIARSGKKIQSVEIRPFPVAMSSEIRKAIEEADLFIFGPGSLYTSVIPNLLIDGLMESINATGRQRVYICNIMTQPGETDGYSLYDHLEALRVHVGDGFPDAVIAHDGLVPSEIIEHYKDAGAEAVPCDLNGQAEFQSVRLITGEFFDQEVALGQGSWEQDNRASEHDECLARHDPDAIARVIFEEFLKKPAAAAAETGATEMDSPGSGEAPGDAEAIGQ
jgi:uncharacterized cofD-like protein